MKIQSAGAIVVIALGLSACAKHQVTGPEKLVNESVVIARFVVQNRDQSTYRLVEVLKDESEGVFGHGVGDVVRVGSIADGAPPPAVVAEKIVCIGRRNPNNELLKQGAYSELYVYDGKIPSLGNVSIAELRAIIAEGWLQTIDGRAKRTGR